MISRPAFRTALQDALRPGTIFAWIGVALFVYVTGMVFQQMGSHVTPLQKFGEVTNVLVFRVVGLASALFSMAVVSQQLERRTMIYLLLRTIPRRTLLWSRTLASMVAASICGVITLCAAGLAVFGPAMLGQSAFWFDLLLVLVGAMAYTSLFVMMSLLIRKPLVVMLLFTFGWEMVPGDMGLMSVLAYLRALAPHPGLDSSGMMNVITGGSSRFISAPMAWLVLIGVTVGLSSLNGMLFQEGEYVARDDD